MVAAPSGLAIGGGYEVVAHCDVLVAHTNIVLGLVESLVGLIPGGGGVKDTLYRWHQKLGDWDKAADKTFMNIGYGKTGTSPQRAGELTGTYTPPRPPIFSWVGGNAFERMQQFLISGRDKGHLTAHDVVVGTELARVVTGGEIDPMNKVSEDELYTAERAAFVRLAQSEATHARIAHMLDQGGTLRN